MPDEQTAKLVAEAVLIPIYGTKFVGKEKPFKTISTNGMWIINIGPRSKLEDYIMLQIARKDGRVSIMNTGEREQKVVKRSEGLVPYSATAVLIAEAVSTPIYGQDSVRLERPFEAVGKGRMGCAGHPQAAVPDKVFGVTKGGVGLVELSREDACVFRVTHGK